MGAMSGERDRNVMVVGADDPAPSRSVRAAVRNRTDLLLVGDAETTLTRVPTGVVQTVITSPPYWSLRDYEAEGQIGMAEPLPIFIKSLVGVFDQVHRVLADDGTVWVNLGDSYTSGNRGWRAPAAL